MAEREMQIEVLTPAECLDLLAERHFGRIGVLVDGRPVIFPVNYVLNDDHVVLRTDPGTKLTAAAQGHVAFEVDHIDESAHTGWSVLVAGVGYEVTDALDATSVAAREFPVDTWAPGQKSHWIRIESEQVSGRRLRPRVDE